MSRCKERGGRSTRPERAVDIELDAPHGEFVTAAVERGALGQHSLRIRAGTIYCVLETQLDPPRAVQLAQLVNLVEGVAGDLQLRPTEPDAALCSDFQRL
jgi:hypothetical protein